MSRPFARMKLGYYPLPVEEARNIHSLLGPSGAYCAIDSCAGDGTALLKITRETCAHLAATEIDADRAAVCIERNSGEAAALFARISLLNLSNLGQQHRAWL